MQPAPALFAAVTHLLGAAGLALAFALLTRRRPAAMVLVARTQSCIVAIAAAWHAWAAGSAVLLALAVAILLGGGVALPWAMGRAATTPRTPLDDAPPSAVVLAAAGALVVLTLLAVPSTHGSGLPAFREDLVLALATALVALLVLATRRASLPQLAGLHGLANGVALATVAVGVALPAAVAVVALFGFVAVGLAVRPEPDGAP